MMAVFNKQNSMMNKKLFARIALLSLGLLSCLAQAESSVWKVSGNKNYFYLGGTIHLLKAEDYPLPREFQAAYNDADKIIFETDLAAVRAPEYQQKFLAAMIYSDKRTLAAELKPETYRKLEKFMASRQWPLDKFAKFQPWGLSLMITTLEY